MHSYRFAILIKMAQHTYTPNYDAIGSDWVCGDCGGMIFTSTHTASRPPIYNPENCSCFESTGPIDRTFGTPATIRASQVQHSSPYDHTVFQPPAPISYASSNRSGTAPGPEEPERDVPNLRLPDGFLQLVPGPGLGEDRHRTASFRSELSWVTRQYLQEQQEAYQRHHSNDRFYHQDYNTTRGQTGESSFLTQEVFVQSSRRSGSGKTKSRESQESSGSMETSLSASETMPNDPIMGVGTWVQGERLDERYMNMSGMTEVMYETERR